MAHSNYFAPQSAVEQIKRHPKYYLNGGDVHFLVENYIYRVHRYFFERESAWFREKLGAPAPAGQAPKGSSDANPFPLDDVAADDFSKFLWVFYNPKYSIYDATMEDWVAILKLAFDWRFGEIKKLCTRELEKFEIPAVQKIELYQMYELDRKLLIPSYMFLCARAEPLSLKEGRQLGLETSLLIATARECARGKPLANGARSPTAAELEEDDMVSIIKEIFGLTAGPPSPSLTPLEKGTGVATFTGTAPTPTTSPRKGTAPPPLVAAAASTAASKDPSGPAKPAPPESPTKPTMGKPSTTASGPTVPTIATPAAPRPSLTASATTSRPAPSPSPFSSFGSFGGLIGNMAGELLGTSASPTVAPSSPAQTTANAPAGNTTSTATSTTAATPASTNNTTSSPAATATATTPAAGGSVFSSAKSKLTDRLMAVFDSQEPPLAPQQAQLLLPPPPEKTPRTPKTQKTPKTPLPWPHPPSNPRSPQHQRETASPTLSRPSRAETKTTEQTLETRPGSPPQARGRPARRARRAASEDLDDPLRLSHKVDGTDGDPAEGDDVHAIHDSTDSTEATNTTDGAGTVTLNATADGSAASGEWAGTSAQPAIDDRAVKSILGLCADEQPTSAATQTNMTVPSLQTGHPNTHEADPEPSTSPKITTLSDNPQKVDDAPAVGQEAPPETVISPPDTSSFAPTESLPPASVSSLAKADHQAEPGKVTIASPGDSTSAKEDSANTEGGSSRPTSEKALPPPPDRLLGEEPEKTGAPSPSLPSDMLDDNPWGLDM